MGHDYAEDRVAEKLEALVRLEAAAGSLIHIRRVNQRLLEQQRVFERVSQRTERRAHGGRFGHFRETSRKLRPPIYATVAPPVVRYPGRREKYENSSDLD